MELLDFDPFTTSRVDLERPAGPFGVNEQPPAAVMKWINRVNPITKKQQQLIAFSWQKVKTAIIVDSLETHCHAWTLQSVKKREALEKSDKRDHAQSLFTLDREGAYRPEGKILFELRTPPNGNPTQNQLNAAEAQLRTSQQAAIDILVADATSHVCCGSRPQHFNVLLRLEPARIQYLR
jgi:hypothetical protein